MLFSLGHWKWQMQEDGRLVPAETREAAYGGECHPVLGKHIQMKLLESWISGLSDHYMP